jgi:hypothetical protein
MVRDGAHAVAAERPVESGPRPERKPVWRRPGMLAVAACAIVALGTLAAFQFSGGPSTSDDTQGSIGERHAHPSSGGTLALDIPPGHRRQGADDLQRLDLGQGPSSGSQASAPNAYNGSSTGWTMTTQLDSNWAEQRRRDRARLQPRRDARGGPGQVPGRRRRRDGGGPHGPVDRLDLLVQERIPGNGFTLQKTESNLAAGQTISVNFSPVSAEYVAIIFTQLQEQGAIQSTNTPAGYRDNLLDVQVLGE